jgi:hypothetical protein
MAPRCCLRRFQCVTTPRTSLHTCSSRKCCSKAMLSANHGLICKCGSPICRPRPCSSFVRNQLEHVQMTLARLPWRRPYFELPTDILPKLKCFYTEGRHLLDLWLSLARRMEHWLFHDVIFGAITVCSSFPGILGHIIKQMMSTR